MPKWTDDQLDAINSQGTGVIVSAAAGSGKTAVLVERTIRLLCDAEKGIEADRLLAVTFTNDAANQMRRKLSDAFAEKLRENPGNEWLALQQARLPMANITTINSFCYNLVKEHIHEFDFDGSVSICDENDSSVMLKEALEAAMESFYIDRPQEMKMLSDALCSSSDKEVADAVLELNRFFESVPFKKRWITSQLERYESDEFFDDINKAAKARVIASIEYILSLLGGALKKAEGIESTDSVAELIKGDITSLRALADRINESSLAAVKLELSGFKLERFKGVKKGADPADVFLCEQVKSIRAAARSQLEKLPALITADEKSQQEDKLFCLEIFKALTALEQKTSDLLREVKLSRGSVSFSDVEHMAIKLLLDENGERTELCREIVKNRDYKIILIDEFQDVNNLQDLIFKAISDADDLSRIGTNMFAVGDVKQSIYRFRLSNPKLFRDVAKSAAYSPERVKRIDLKKNFRSRKPVIDAVNYFFEGLMTAETGEINYSDESERLVCGAGFDNGNNSPVEVDIIDEEQPLLSYFGFDNEQLFVAQRIAELIQSGVTVEENGEVRKALPSDFCVLTRGRSAHKGLSKALEYVGLKCSFDGSEGYLRSREVSVILNFLRVIDNPANDIALLSVMESPVFVFSDDEAAMIRGLDKKAKLYLNLKAAGESDALPTALVQKASSAYSAIGEMRFLSAGLSTEKLIRKIYDKMGYYACAAAFKDSAGRDNLSLLLTYAVKFDESSGKGLAGFLRYINAVFENGGDFKRAEKKSLDKNSVTVTTMHSSKGLEYPFVFLCDLDKQMNLSDASGSIIINEQLGISFTYRNTEKHIKCVPQHYTALKENLLRESISEEIRILYVAMTRAKERLFLPIYLNKRNKSKLKNIALELSGVGKLNERMILSTDGMLRWIMLLLLTHKDCRKLRAASEVDLSELALCGEQGLFSEICVTPSISAVKVDKGALFANVNKDSEPIDMTFDYDSSLCDTLAKLSVSEVVKEDKSFVFYPSVPDFSEEMGNFTAAERGTIAHSFMELCDLTRASKSVDDEIKRLVNEKKLTQRKAEVLDKKAIRGFFESDIFERLAAAKSFEREKSFLVKISELDLDDERLLKYKGTDGMLRGVADCVFEEEDGYVIIDYKTDRVRDEKDLAENYADQLKLYTAALNLILDKPVKAAYLYSFVLRNGILINSQLGAEAAS